MVASQKTLLFWSEEGPERGLTVTTEGGRRAQPTFYAEVTPLRSFTIPNSAGCWRVGELAYVIESLVNLCSGLRM